MIDGGQFASYCRCPYEWFLASTGAEGEETDYGRLRGEARSDYIGAALAHLLAGIPAEQIDREPQSLRQAIKSGRRAVLGLNIEAMGLTLEFPMIECHRDGRSQRPDAYVPVVFSHDARPCREDLLLATLHGMVLAEAIERPVPFVKLVHGPRFSATKLKLEGPSGPTRLAAEARALADRLRVQAGSASRPALTLNSHCPACRFRVRCRGGDLQGRPEPPGRDVGEGDPGPAPARDQNGVPARVHVQPS